MLLLILFIMYRVLVAQEQYIHTSNMAIHKNTVYSTPGQQDASTIHLQAADASGSESAANVGVLSHKGTSANLQTGVSSTVTMYSMLCSARRTWYVYFYVKRINCFVFSQCK